MTTYILIINVSFSFVLSEARAYSCRPRDELMNRTPPNTLTPGPRGRNHFRLKTSLLKRFPDIKNQNSLIHLTEERPTCGKHFLHIPTFYCKKKFFKAVNIYKAETKILTSYKNKNWKPRCRKRHLLESSRDDWSRDKVTHPSMSIRCCYVPAAKVILIFRVVCRLLTPRISCWR